MGGPSLRGVPRRCMTSSTARLVRAAYSLRRCAKSAEEQQLFRCTNGSSGPFPFGPPLAEFPPTQRRRNPRQRGSCRRVDAVQVPELGMRSQGAGSSSMAGFPDHWPWRNPCEHTLAPSEFPRHIAHAERLRRQGDRGPVRDSIEAVTGERILCILVRTQHACNVLKSGDVLRCQWLRLPVATSRRGAGFLLRTSVNIRPGTGFAPGQFSSSTSSRIGGVQYPQPEQAVAASP